MCIFLDSNREVALSRSEGRNSRGKKKYRAYTDNFNVLLLYTEMYFVNNR